MPHIQSISLDLSHAEAITKTREALTQQGFGVLTEIDVQATTILRPADHGDPAR